MENFAKTNCELDRKKITYEGTSKNESPSSNFFLAKFFSNSMDLVQNLYILVPLACLYILVPHTESDVFIEIL